MNDNVSYTTEEIAAILKISKLTVYNLFKRGKLPFYRVGREMRVDASDLEAYKRRGKSTQASHSHRILEPSGTPRSYNLADSDYRQFEQAQPATIVITGQDASLDILSNHIEKTTRIIRPLRSYAGSMDSLVSMYNGEADVVSTHLLDGDTGEYNIPYIRRILVGRPLLVVSLVSRFAGIYVQEGNPKNITTWKDIGRIGIRMVNREKGSGARVLLDEQMRLLGINTGQIDGYEDLETNHLAVAGRIADNQADVGIGIEKAANMVGVEFIPLVVEKVDLVMLKETVNLPWIRIVCEILQSASFHNQLRSIRGYDLSNTGKVIYET